MDSDGLRIFLASPSGLDAYRRAARDAFEHIRSSVARRRGVDFDPIGWEDLPPGFGRPQSVINPKLDECNVLIGILGKELGTPTGAAESGFVEEYERMAARALDGEEVAIWIYVLHLTPDDLADPGDKLKAVMAFRERLFGEALIKEFRGVEDFSMLLYKDLVSLVLDVDERQERSDIAATPSAAEAQPSPTPEVSDEAGRQLQQLLSEAATEAPLLSQRFRDDRFPLMRLALWLSTWEGWYVTSETFGLHQLNRLYIAGAEVVLSQPERRHLLRTMCAHRRVAPGWALLDYGADQLAPELLTLATGDQLDEVRVGAFEMLDRDPLETWLARDDVSLDEGDLFARFEDGVDELGDRVRVAMVGFAVRFGGGGARSFLERLADRDATKTDAVRALIRSYSTESFVDVVELGAHAEVDLDEDTLLAVRMATSDAHVRDLERLVDEARDERLRIVCVEALAARGREGVPGLLAALDDQEDQVAVSAFSGLCTVGDPEFDPEAAFKKLITREDLKFDDDLQLAVDRTRGEEVLRDAVSWLDISTASAYRVLAEEQWDDFSEVVRRDLQDRFETFAQEGRERYMQILGVEVVDALMGGGESVLIRDNDGTLKPVQAEDAKRVREFLAGSQWSQRRFAVAALAGVARNGGAGDAPFVHSWLDSEHREVREGAAQALARVGAKDDVARLLELDRQYGESAFVEAALHLAPGPSGAATEVLDHSARSTSALLAARHLYAYADYLSDATVEALLAHASEPVRRVGVACALARYEGDAPRQLIDRYTSTGRYYYNVIYWFDRALFAPEYLCARTRAELDQFASETGQSPLPSRSDSGTRYLASAFGR